MSSEVSDSKVTRLRFECGTSSSTSDLVAQLAESIGRQLGADIALVTLYREERTHIGLYTSSSSRSDGTHRPIFEVARDGATFRGQVIGLPVIVKDLQRARVQNDLSIELAVRNVRSFGAFPLIARGELFGIVECYFTSSYHRWLPEEVQAFEDLAQVLRPGNSAVAASVGRQAAPPSEEARGQYTRMAQYGNVLIIITDSQFGITDVFGDPRSILGIEPSEMKHNSRIWERIIDPRDQNSLHRRILRLRLERGELNEEVRAIHQLTGEVHWVMLRAVPQFTPSGEFLGWEGFGIDVTERRIAQDALANQSARVEALLEVARALQGHTDPAIVLLKGLRALLTATGSACGYGCFYHHDSDDVELVASHGLSERYIEQMDPVLKGPSLLRTTIKSKLGSMIPDIQEDRRAHSKVARIEDLRSAILMPLVLDEEVYGIIVIFTREKNSYSQGDFDLVSAAAVQIALAVRQTYMFDAERQHSQTLSALYRISHELAKYRTPREIAERAFPILQQEFMLRRGWFGVVNEQGTHIVGQAGFGAGVKRRLQQVQIELNLRHDFLDEALKTQRPVVVPTGATMECSGLQRVVELLKLETLVVVPLVSLGQVIGVVIVEPAIPHLVLKEPRLQLLAGMINEMSTVLMARRLELRVAEGLKMRMAGLLASGVAHNFNNMLQAILGQVALLEMQLPQGAPALESARMITDAAKRGASLVSQLINFSSQKSGMRHSVNVNQWLSESQELYASLLGKRTQLRLQLCVDGPDVVLDPAQIQQVITNLLINAKEALDGNEADGLVSISVAKVRLRTAEIDPELAPGAYVRIDVSDNGMGMNGEQQLRCFEPFYTTKNVDPSTGVGLTGSGLGLAAAYSLVKQHNGLITVSSKVGNGSTFSVYLPIQEGGQSNIESKPVTRGGGLLLGFDAGAQSVVASLLDSLGYSARSVYDVAQAREVLGQGGGAWRVIVADADIIGEGGVDRCKQLLKEFPDLGLVIVTGIPAEAALERSAPKIVVLEKPLGVWSLEDALKNI